jgi:anti-sigma regulatory factor (Ser/Thr protein kinase)
MADRFTLELPPEPISIGTARLFSATVARFFGTQEEAVEDLKLAVSEACTVAIRANEAQGGRVHLAIEGGRPALTFSIPDGGSASTDRTDPLEVASGELIRALFPSAEFVPTAERRADVRFSVPTGS